MKCACASVPAAAVIGFVSKLPPFSHRTIKKIVRLNKYISNTSWRLHQRIHLKAMEEKQRLLMYSSQFGYVNTIASREN
jgi:hypothetical protein